MCLVNAWVDDLKTPIPANHKHSLKKPVDIACANPPMYLETVSG
ncbi:hypothetical protein EDF88_0840 [Buttiauxella sp. BIGb0552]|nr:hypothetical protein EDF88_0840 [Buttiauxella sp. BIGb0552]